MTTGELIRRLRDAFKSEAQERLKSITTSILQLQEVSASPELQRALLEVLFREAHGLKGASRVVNLVAVEDLCQSVEDTVGVLKREEAPLTPAIIEEIHVKVCRIEEMVRDFRCDQPIVRGVA